MAETEIRTIRIIIRNSSAGASDWQKAFEAFLKGEKLDELVATQLPMDKSQFDISTVDR